MKCYWWDLIFFCFLYSIFYFFYVLLLLLEMDSVEVRWMSCSCPLNLYKFSILLLLFSKLYFHYKFILPHINHSHNPLDEEYMMQIGLLLYFFLFIYFQTFLFIFIYHNFIFYSSLVEILLVFGILIFQYQD